METEFKELEQENSILRNELENIAFINNMEDDELKNFWGTINKLINNEIEQEKHCNK